MYEKEKAINMAKKYGVTQALDKAWNITKKEIDKVKIEKIDEIYIKEYDYDIYNNHITIYAAKEEKEKIFKELKEKRIKILDRGE
jgi:hypothetical protein